MSTQDLAKMIVGLVGGQENILTLIHCVTRLRIKVKDEAKIQTDELSALEGVIKVFYSRGQLQIVTNGNVAELYEQVRLTAQIRDEAEQKGNGKTLATHFFDFMTASFTPIIALFAGSGMLKGLTLLLASAHLLNDSQPAYYLLMAAGNATFYFMPILLGFTATKTLGANPFVGAMIGASLLEPNFLKIAELTNQQFLGITLDNVSYGSTVIPVLVSSIMYSYFERAAKKILPNNIQLFMIPFLGLLLIVPLTALFFGPVASLLSSGISNGFNFFYDKAAIPTGALIGALWFILVIFGLQWAIIPIMFLQLGVEGFTTLPPLVLASSYGQMGVTLAIIVLTKDKELRTYSSAALATSVITGIAEPILYGLIMRYRKTLAPLLISGAVGGALAAFFQIKFSFVPLGGITTLLAVTGGLKAIGFYVVVMFLVPFVLGFLLMLPRGFENKM